MFAAISAGRAQLGRTGAPQLMEQCISYRSKDPLLCCRIRSRLHRHISHSNRTGSRRTPVCQEPIWLLEILLVERKRATTATVSVLPAWFPCDSHVEQRSEEHTSELQSRLHLVCRLLLEK